MTEQTPSFSDKIEQTARQAGASVSRAIDEHVSKQQERFGAHLSGAEALYRKLPGVPAAEDSKPDAPSDSEAAPDTVEK